MSIVTCAARVGAAAFLLGVGFGGPQVLGVASADSGDSEGSSASAGPAKSHSGGSARSKAKSSHVGRADASRRAPVARASAAAIVPAQGVSNRSVTNSPANAPSASANPLQSFFGGLGLQIRRSFFNQAPTVNPVQLTGEHQGVITGTVGAVDPEGDPLKYTLLGDPLDGAVVLNPDGTFTYTPGDDFAGVDVFNVAVRDTGFHINLLNLFRAASTRARVLVEQDVRLPAPQPPAPCTTICVSFTFNYVAGADLWTSEARAGLEAAAKVLASYFLVGAPVNLTYDVTGYHDTSSSNFPPLASAGSSFSYGNGVFNDTVVQRKIIKGIDQNGGSADGVLNWNFDYAWDWGDDLSSGEHDAQTVVLHELLHSFGFVSSVDAPGVFYNGGAHTVWDSFIVNSDGVHPLSSDGVWDTAYNANLTGGNGGLYFGGANAVAAYGGLVPLYTSSPFSNSTLSHLGDRGFVMTAGIRTGEQYVLSAAELGILKDLGYKVIPYPQADAMVFIGLAFLRRRKR